MEQRLLMRAPGLNGDVRGRVKTVERRLTAESGVVLRGTGTEIPLGNMRLTSGRPKNANYCESSVVVKNVLISLQTTGCKEDKVTSF